MLNLLNRLGLDRKKTFTIAAAVGVTIFLDVTFLIGAQLKGIKNTNAKVAKLKTQLANFNQDLANMQELQQQGDLEKVSLKEKKALSQEEVPFLLEEISDIANKNKIKIIQMKPFRKPESKEDKSAAASKFITLLISVDLDAKYHNLGQFLNDLENAKRFIAVQDMLITRDPNEYFSQNIRLTLVTYVKK